jgi:hypothetical protein
MTDDPLSDLNRRLFEAAHAERPTQALRERLLRSGQTELGAGPTETARSARVRKARPGAMHWLLAAAMIGSLLLVVRSLLQPASVPDVPLISAERLTNAARGVPAAGGRTSPEPEAAALQPSPPPTEAPLKAPPASVPSPRRESPDVVSGERASAPTPPPSRATLAEELEWLKRARAALRSGDPARSLELLQAYESELGGSDLRDEASVLHIEALAAAGRHGEASALAERFASQNPNSPLVDRARSFLRRSETPNVP